MKRIGIICTFILSHFTMFAADYKSGSDNALIYSWSKDDVAGIYTTGGTRIKHWAEDVDNDAHYALFSSRAWALVANTSYYAYSPYSSYYYDNECPITALPVSYDNQTQNGNDDTRHLAAYDYMMAEGRTTATAADFSLRHLGSVLRIQLHVPADNANQSPTSLSLSMPSSSVIPVAAAMNLPEQRLITTSTATTLTLNLENIIFRNGNVLVAYMMIAPFTCPTGEYPTLTLYSGKRVLMSVKLLATTFAEGHCYNINSSAASSAKWHSPSGSITATSIQSSLQTPVLFTPDFLPADIGVVTGIEVPTVTEQPESPQKSFTIDGRILPTYTPHGIVIRNGKKYIIR